jgi:uncharacterized protein (UPF0261 family)
MQEDASRRRMERIYVVGTADTKGEELGYTAREIAAAGGTPLIVDVGTRQPRRAVDIAAEEVARHHPDGADAVLGPADCGTAVAAMGAAFARFVASRNDIAGIVGSGGSGGTSIVTAGMRELPIGLPKDTYDCIVFRATGTGGRAMKHLPAEAALIDRTRRFKENRL